MEATGIFFAVLGWLAFIVNEWDKGVRKQKQNFDWKIFRRRNLPAALFNLIAMVTLAGITVTTKLELSIMEWFMSGYMGGQILKSRINGKV